jgi:GNAT superfamily N-acetyltransferase
MPLHVRRLDRPEDPDRVIRLAWEVGRPHPQWVPYYLRDERRRLLRREYRYFTDRKVRAEGFGAFEGERLMAAATAYVDPPLGAHLERQLGLLGQFECLGGVDATPVLDAAHEWLAAEGAREVWAPANCPFQIEGGGVLTEGGERSAPFLSVWTPAHYAEPWGPAGYRPIQSYHNYVVDLTAAELPGRMAEHRRRAEAQGVTFRPADRRRFDRDHRLIAELYNATFNRHWGHAPMEVEHFVELTASLREIVRPGLVVFAERGGETLGVRVAFPQLEPVFRVLDGDMSWWKYPRLPFALRRVAGGISLLVGVRPEARGLGIAPALSACVYEEMRRRRYRTVVHTAVFDDNVNSQRQVGKMGGVPDQGWTIFGRTL